MKPHLDRNSPVRKFGKALRRQFTRMVRASFSRPTPITAAEVADAQRILLIRPNFRLGNAAISTAVIACFRAHYPRAHIAFLGTDKTLGVLTGQPVDERFAMSRKHLTHPWRFLWLVRQLRRRRYDLAVQINPGSFSGYLMARLVGARHTMGHGKNGERWYDLEVPGGRGHAYDNAVRFADVLGSPCPDGPVIHLTDAERDQARARLEQHLRAPITAAGADYVAICVGGRAGKHWPAEFWLALVEGLEREGCRYIVFLGPEEAGLARYFRAAMAGYTCGTVLDPQPLREFCALLAFARCLVTPDSGPMHLGAGLGVPMVTLVRDPVSRKFVPRGGRDRALKDPSPAAVRRCVHGLLAAETRTLVGETSAVPQVAKPA